MTLEGRIAGCRRWDGMKLHYSDLIALIEYTKDEANQKGDTVHSVDDLLDYLEDNHDKNINFK